MQFTKRQWQDGRVWRPLVAAVVVGLLLGFAGPFGSNPAYPRPTRYAFWLGLTVAGMVFVLVTDAALRRNRPKDGWRRVLATGLLSAVPMTFVVAWTMSFLQPGRAFAPHQLPALFVAVAAIQLLIAYAASVSRPAVTMPAPVVEAPATFPAALVSKLPAGIGRDIVAIETEDHYLRIHTSGGSALVLMRMADAVALIDPRLGAQVHRRWWVADSAVTDIASDGQKLSIYLDGGNSIPVGRTFAAEARTRFAGTRKERTG